LTAEQASPFRAGFLRLPCSITYRGQVSVGKYADRMSGGGIPEACLSEIPDPLEAFKKEIERRKRGRRRTNRVALFPNRYEEEVLFDIGLACARLWNELNYEKRWAFFNGELSPGKRDEINKKYYY
jgi:hypothetical protein